MNEHRFDVNVSFRLNNILELNGRSLESVDVTPGALAEIVELVDDDITQQLGKIAVFDSEYRPTSSRKTLVRPVVLVARLALIDQPYNALTRTTLIAGQRHINHASLLSEEARPYWNSIDTTGFQPQVHVLDGGDKDASGVWLGVSEV